MIVITGTVTVKLVELVPVLHPMVTVIGPVVAPIGTVAVIVVIVLAVTTAVVPLNFTILFARTALKFVPVMIIDIPTGPLVGAKEEIVGALLKGRNDKGGLPTTAPTKSGILVEKESDILFMTRLPSDGI